MAIKGTPTIIDKPARPYAVFDELVGNENDPALEHNDTAKYCA